MKQPATLPMINLPHNANPANEVKCEIGTLDGYPVIGEFAGGWLMLASCNYNGIELSTDGRTFASVPMKGDFSGDMRRTDWYTIKALADTNVVGRLMELVLVADYAHLTNQIDRLLAEKEASK